MSRPTSKLWNDDETERLKKAWIEVGLSGAQIATEMTRRLGATITRGAVIGKLERMGLMGQGFGSGRNRPPRIGHVPRAKKPVVAKASKPPNPPRAQVCNLAAVNAVRRAESQDIPIPALKELEDLGIGIPFIGRTSAQCAWPIGEPDADMRCCGREAVEGKPYCKGYCDIAYKPTIEITDRTQGYYSQLGATRHSTRSYEDPQPLDRMAA
jgi:hypothetical protein